MAVKQRSNKYWARRAEEGLNKALKTSASYERLINRVYTEASINLTQELQRLYKNAYKGDKSFDMDKLNAIEPSGNVERFKATMRRQGLYTRLPDNYKGRLTRLEMLDAQIWAEVKRAGQKETAYNTDAYRKIVNNGYKNAQSVIAKGTNTSFTFNKLNTGAVNTILNNKFDGANYSERIWGQTDVLANELQQKLATAVATGQNYERTAREFRQRFNVKKSYAERLIRTESCYFETEAKLQAYKDLGITELVFVATLDSRTSEICQHADGERIKISEAVVGENIPPLHPNCRSTVRAYISEEFEPTERVVNGANMRNVYVQHQNYLQWNGKQPINAANTAATTALATNATKDNYALYTPELEDVLQKRGDELYNAAALETKRALDFYTDAGSATWNTSIGKFGEVINENPSIISDEELVHQLLNKSSLGTDTVVYSGLSYPESWAGKGKKVGDVFTQKTYCSASLLKEVGEEFAGYSETDEILLIIKVPKNAKALYLGNNSDLKGDKELIINRDTKYKVQHIKTKTYKDAPTRKEITLEVIP